MVGCLLSGAAEELSKRSVVHAPATLSGPAHTKNATSAMSEHTDASEMRVFRPQYGHNLACYCEKRAAAGYTAGPAQNYGQVAPTSITMGGRGYLLNIPIASALRQSIRGVLSRHLRRPRGRRPGRPCQRGEAGRAPARAMRAFEDTGGSEHKPQITLFRRANGRRRPETGARGRRDACSEAPSAGPN